MKRTACIIAALCVCCAANADTLIKRNGDEMTCRVIRITPSVIVYSLPGQTVEREIPVNEIFMAKYDNGSKEMFNTGGATSSGSSYSGKYSAGRTSCSYDEFFPVTTCPVINTDYSGLAPASRRYQMWDIYEENGLRGVVVEVTDDGRHGKIISLPTINYFAQSSFSNLPDEFYFGGSDYINGEYNTDMIRRTCADAGMVGKGYPKLLKWLDSLGPGWYIPSYGELLKLNYEFQMDKGEVGMKQFQAAMKRAGGDQIKKYHRLASSSETRLVNSLTMAFAIVKFDKDTYSKVDSPGYISGEQRAHGWYKAYHKF
ncbi:MAG: hypothetical protein ACI30O_03195 [Muribaculaceae bacterium]